MVLTRTSFHCPPDSSGVDDFDNSFLDDEQFDSDDSLSLSHQSFNEALYQQYIIERSKVKLLKKKLMMSLSHDATKKADGSAKVGFSRFSLSTFSNVINSLSDVQKDFIRKQGFGSLLLFDNCSVPQSFVHWVARLVNPNSGDIVLDGKVISLTKEAVHMVLDLPFGGSPFPVNFSFGKACLLSRFGLDDVPPISFFSDALLSKNPMSDDDMFVCFIVVAMSIFLCPNSSVVPCPNFFGIFEDLSKIRSFDWCGFVLSWLLHYIKLFNQFKSCKSPQQAPLGGCLYFLAVVYLDHVDFGPHQVASTIPRLSVWKKDMISRYASLDRKQEGCFGYHPIMDFSRTCYAKDMSLLPQFLNQIVDDEFVSKLDSAAHGSLPSELKDAICKLVRKHCLNCGFSVNLDVNSISALSDEIRLTFIKLWKHAFSVNEMSQALVLDLIRLLSESIEDNPPIGGVHHAADPSPAACDGCMRESNPSGSVIRESDPSTSGAKSNGKLYPDVHLIHPSQYKLQQASAPNSSSPDGLCKLKKNCYPDANPSPAIRAASCRKVLGDISNSKSLSKVKFNSVRGNGSPVLEVVDLENANLYVPDFISPSSMSGYTRYVPHRSDSSAKKSGSSLKKSGCQSSRDGLLIQNLDFNQVSPSPPKAGHGVTGRCSSGSLPSSSKIPAEASPEVVFVGAKSFSNSVAAMTQKCNAIYNEQNDLGGCSRVPLMGQSRSSLPSYARLSQSYVNKSQDLSTGGRVPGYVPRHFLNPAPVCHGDYIMPKSKFYQVSKSEVENYKILCKLACSQFQCEDAVSMSGVRCTFWSLGESMKPGGFVNNYVIACFCYSLFSKPNGHPDQSRRHYFFPNIGDNLLLPLEKADEAVLHRSFTKSSRTRALNKLNLIFFPILHEDHWFVFVIDLKEHEFVFLDSIYDQNSIYHQEIDAQLMNSFKYYWNKFVRVEMDFNLYGLKHPKVPAQPIDSFCDSGIYAMVFLEHWSSSRVLLSNLFSHEDIPSIRVKIANELFFPSQEHWNETACI